MTPKVFYNTYIGFAQQSEAVTKVPALFTLAQAALESSWSTRAVGNNFFGLKAMPDTPLANKQLLDTHEFINGVRTPVKAWFMKYATPAEGFIDHGNFLVRNERYKPALQFTDPILFAKAIAAAGYATDPLYATKIISIIKMLHA